MNFPQLVTLASHVACSFSEFSRMKQIDRHRLCCYLVHLQNSSKNMTILWPMQNRKGDKWIIYHVIHTTLGFLVQATNGPIYGWNFVGAEDVAYPIPDFFSQFLRTQRSRVEHELQVQLVADFSFVQNISSHSFIYRKNETLEDER